MSTPPGESTHRTGWDGLFSPATFLAIGGLAAILAGIAAALPIAPASRAVAGALIVALVACYGAGLRRHDRRLLARAAEAAVAPPEREGVVGLSRPLDCNNAADLARALHQAAGSIAEREAHFALLARATGDAVWDWDLATNMIACSHGGRTVLGAEAEAFCKPFSWWQERVHPEDRDLVEQSAAAVRAGASNRWSVEYRFLHAAGSYRCVWDRGVVVHDDAGRGVRIVGCITDISARKEAEEMLQHVERRQHALITAVSNIVWRDDLLAPIQPRNVAWEEYTGQTQDEEFGEGWLDAVHPEDRAGMLHAWSSAMRDGSNYQADIRLRRHDGTYRWMSARGAPVRDKAGNIVEWIGLYEDVEDYYAAREELRSKTHTLGERVKELRCLHAITTFCNREEMRVAEILSGAAVVLPSALVHPQAGSCRIECEGATFESPDYLDPSVAIETPLHVDGLRVGRITLGYAGRSGELSFLPEEEQLLRTAASLIGQMLARRLDRNRLQQQSQELWRRQAMFEQTERLAKLGGWEYHVAEQRMTWSDEVRRIASIDAETGADDDERPAAFLHEAIQEALRTGQPFDLELPWQLQNGAYKWLHTVGQVQVADDRPVRIFGMVKDITEEKEARSRIWHIAHHDALTGLPNRRYFQERLEAALADGKPGQALLLIDLDHFKEVNDTLGHDVGDAFLCSVAERLQDVVGSHGTVARLGGDEFAVLASTPDRAAAQALSEMLLSHLRRPIAFAGQSTPVRVSAGLAVCPEDGSSATELLKSADIALYSGKTRGRSAFVAYQPKLREDMELRLAVCSQVRAGIERDEFEPYYQPKICLRTGGIAGFEALLRWRDRGGVRTPSSLMAAFEDHELAVLLSGKMLDRIVADMSAWRASGLPFRHVALNTSAADFAAFDLADKVLGGLAAAALPAETLSIEVTETVLLGREAEMVGPTLRELHAAGISIALDDFGTGYASLTHLQQFPVDVIKIDRSFIAGIGNDIGSQAITAAVLGLGRNLGMTVVAEGVETAEQAQFLSAAGCSQAQGFYFARPMCGNEIPGFLRNWPGVKFERAAPVALSAA